MRICPTRRPLAVTGPSALATFAVSLLFASCGPTPERLVEVAEKLVQARRFEDLSFHIDGQYGDPLGDRSTLFRDLEQLDRDFPRWTIDWTREQRRLDTSALMTATETRLRAELVGQPAWKIEGPMLLSLHRTDRWRIQGGLLSDFRDIRSLMRARQAALEANDVPALADLLHPLYRDGIADKAETVARLTRDLTAVRVRMQITLYRLEIRRDLAHIDEHYRLTVNDRPGRPAVAGLTLRKTAGRWRIAAGLYGEDNVRARQP